MRRQGTKMNKSHTREFQGRDNSQEAWYSTSLKEPIEKCAGEITPVYGRQPGVEVGQDGRL